MHKNQKTLEKLPLPLREGAGGGPERRPGKGLTLHHKVVTDELLDHLAERFLGKKVREMTRCTFDQYISHPEAWERIAEALQDGCAVRYDPRYPGIVAIIPPAGARAN